MITKHINIPEYRWGSLVIYGIKESDKEEVMAICQSFGMKSYKFEKAWSILMTPNSGMAITNDMLRMSAIFIGKQTSKGQFLNTLSHECSHVASYITEYYDISCRSEEFAYLQGDLFQKVIEEIANIDYQE